ncbi:hypothetical protein EON65_33070 [archaeon]|nr:MAG: hypothetical protein EON65_33070 [archaeon]
MSQIAHQTKVKQKTVEAMLHKWKQHHTIQDQPKTGRLSLQRGTCCSSLLAVSPQFKHLPTFCPAVTDKYRLGPI